MSTDLPDRQTGTEEATTYDTATTDDSKSGLDTLSHHVPHTSEHDRVHNHAAQLPHHRGDIHGLGPSLSGSQSGSIAQAWTEDGMSSVRDGRSPFARMAAIDPYSHVREDMQYSGRYLSYAPSAESLIHLLASQQPHTPRHYPNGSTTGEDYGDSHLSNDTLVGQQKPASYPSWTAEPSTQAIEAVFAQLGRTFGFQRDSVHNMFDHLLTMLDSRASRMSPITALHSLHADYIGGPHANYRQWYFATFLNREDTENSEQTAESKSSCPKQFKQAQNDWQAQMERLSDSDRVRQLALWLLIWGEASVVRYCPEALCFLFKCANDYDVHRRNAALTEVDYETNEEAGTPEGAFLDTIITPLYQFIRDQSYIFVNGNWVSRERDHAEIIGYDDVNQLFWSLEQMTTRLRLGDKRRLLDLPAHERYSALAHVQWKKAFQKSYKEKRSWMHLATNFTRIWIIHLVSFWYYMSANAEALYLAADKDEAALELPVRLSITALGGALAALMVMIGTLTEMAYVPVAWGTAGILLRRCGCLFGLILINTGPAVYCIFFDRTSTLSLAIGIVHLLVSVCTSIFLAVVPQSKLFVKTSKEAQPTNASQTFTANFPRLKRIDRCISIGLWVCVFACKLVESYFFVALSFKDPFAIMANMSVDTCKDPILGTTLCRYMPLITLGLMVLMELILFFLDTYLWYVIWNTIFSVARSFYMGVSICTPWRNMFSRLPKRIYAKILAVANMEMDYKPKDLCSQVWNAIVISMYREHLLSANHIGRLLYRQVPNAQDGTRTVKPPTFFVSQEDVAFKTEYYPRQSEAERRMQFFAESLTTPMPEPMPVPNMPTFTVLTPHYSEKILLTLREIIRQDDNHTRITLLEYLKHLHPFEWDNFVKDTKIFVDEAYDDTQDDLHSLASEKTRKQADDLPFYCFGFKSSEPKQTLRTRIWASLRTQTLYRTITGFMNYQKAIKLLYRVESPEMPCASSPSFATLSSSIDSKLDSELDQMASRKFRFLLAMQRYTSFSAEEREATDVILQAYPDLQIAYIDKVTVVKDDKEETSYYSVLIDGHCPILANGERLPKYRVRLPGNPILGDGKSDNQNNALIFYRGEYLQLIDANQDNYLEECLKIRSVLGEFEPALEHGPYDLQAVPTSPVAIVGAGEYIFSENTGILGDIAAGKEKTFGTLSQRIMAVIGGKLHYGHPDFLNAVFMTTRGGVSKAQKGLHLNEDIYAGMNAFERGGRIKHIEYYQCGKGRDLGFGSILNFTTKIGTGMGEQMLSREYYYLGTQLPLDRFLTFYYAHPGFHVNNIFIMLSVQLFILVVLCLGVLAMPLTLCKPISDPAEALLPEGCYNLLPVFDWLRRVVLSIFVVFFASLLPLFLHELTDRGFLRAVTRLAKQLLSLSSLFEIFVTQTYAHAILSNLTFGGARYIATGRGLATTRIAFSQLYARFADTSLYLGARNGLILLFASMVLWIPHLVYFWVTIAALIFSPFLFNPHQFSRIDFLIDYREFLRWLSRGNGKSHDATWIAFCRSFRMRITGVKRKGSLAGQPAQPRARFVVIFFSEIVLPILVSALCVTAYMFVKSTATDDQNKSGVLRVGVIAMAPVLLNAGGLAVLFALSLLGGSIASLCCGVKFGATIAAVAHGWAVLNLILVFELLYFLEDWQFTHTLLGMIAASSIQRCFFKIITILFLTREFQQDQSNQGWWTGRWYGRQLGWHAFSQPLREYICKIVESSLFAADFILSHVILMFLFPLCFLPQVDKWHSRMLFWLKSQPAQPIYSARMRHARRKTAILYGILLTTILLVLLGLAIVPAILGPRISLTLSLPI